MRTLHDNPFGSGSIYERHNMKILCIRLPAYVVAAPFYGI
jgi:sodium-dependent phosphate transporter